MNGNPSIGPERREAIARASRAAVRLSVDPEARPVGRVQVAIVNDVGLYTNREAWDAVQALEGMVLDRGLITREQIEAERRATELSVLMGEDGDR